MKKSITIFPNFVMCINYNHETKDIEIEMLSGKILLFSYGEDMYNNIVKDIKSGKIVEIEVIDKRKDIENMIEIPDFDKIKKIHKKLK